MNRITPFKTNIYVVKNIKHNVLNLVYDEMQKNKGVSISNHGGWQSESQYYDSHSWMLPVIHDIGNYMRTAYDDIGLTKHDILLDNYWFNINKKYSYNTQHKHPFSYFSACWYLKTSPNCGNIVFHRPDTLLEWIPIDISNENNWESWWVEPSDYDLIIFPAYLSHSVNMNMSDEDRVSIAFNFK